MNTAPLVYDISGSYDAFSRLRISETLTIFDCKLLYDKQPLFWDEMQTSGNGTTGVHNSNQASVTLSVSSNIAGTRVRQTYQRFSYQPGKSQLILMSGIFGSNVTGVTKRLGCFDSNNGLFFQVGPEKEDFYIVKRTSVTGAPVDLQIPQTQWNKNKLISQDLISFDLNKANIFYFNYEWLGVGDIFCGVVLGGKYVPLHQFYVANNIHTVSLSLPNLPLRYEISNNGSGNTDKLTCICTTVISEGGQQNIGYIFTIDRGNSPLSISTSGVLYPILSVRLKPDRTAVNVYLEGINIITTTTNVIFRWGIYLNPTFAGAALTWTNFNNNCFQYNNTTTNTTSISGGILLNSGYAIGTNASVLTNQIAAKFSLGTSIAGVSDVLVLALERLDNQNDVFYASMAIRESV